MNPKGNDLDLKMGLGGGFRAREPTRYNYAADSDFDLISKTGYNIVVTVRYLLRRQLI